MKNGFHSNADAILLKNKVAVITGAGYSPGHQATEALAMMRAVPGMTVIDPCDAHEIEQAVPAIAAHNTAATWMSASCTYRH